MEDVSFVASEGLMQPQYEAFHLLAEYDREHPLHRFYDYILQFFGGIREDVLQLFCESEKIKQLAELLEASRDAGLKNEWYRRLIRLLQCNAEAEWYQMFLLTTEDKSSGYVQYFFNQLPAYAESGVSCEKVKQLFLENKAAYLLEYQIHELLRKERREEKTEENECQKLEPKLVVLENVPKLQEQPNLKPLAEWQKLMEPLLESQKNIQTMLQDVLSQRKEPKEILQSPISNVLGNMEEVASDDVSENMGNMISDDVPADFENILVQQLQTTEVSVKESLETETPEIAEEKEVGETYRQEKENALRFARLFQQIRIKRKKVQLRKLERTRQLQELVTLMQKKGFSMDEMQLVRSLIEREVSLEFLYVIIEEEIDAGTKLKQMCEFLEKQQEEISA